MANRGGRWGRVWQAVGIKRCRGNGNGSGKGMGKGMEECKGGCGCTLESLGNGQEGVICRVPPHPLLAPLGFRPGKRVRVCARERFGGPVIAQVERRNVALSRSLAGQIELAGGEGGRVLGN